jgi:AmmeMemoRadiSam system protein A
MTKDGSGSTAWLSDEHKRALLDVARASVLAQVRGGEPPDPRLHVPEASGVFVTVRNADVLRGCLGTLQCRAGLALEVARCASEAASRDPRFSPMTADELPHLSIEVSVLGPLEPIDPRAAGAIEIGRHGLVVEQGRRRGLLLPQVATEWSWTPEQFLHHTCLKAGLPSDAWMRGATVYRFEADVFGD